MPEFIQAIIGILNSIFDITILIIYLKCILQHKKNGVSRLVYSAGFILVCFFQYIIGSFTNSWTINVFFSLLCIFLLTFFYDNKMLTRIFAPISFQVFAMLAEVLSYTIIQFLQSKHLIISDVDGTLYANSFSKLILFIIVLVVSGFIKKNTAILTIKDSISMLITPLVSIAIIIAITFQFEKEVVYSGTAICFSVAGIMIINLIVYYLLENIIEATEIQEKQLQMETQFDYQEKKYEHASQSFKNISSIIHDTNKHLIYIRECILENQSGEAIRYINQAIDAVEKSYKRFHTGNLVIDALLSNAANVAANNKIVFKSDLRIDSGKINIERYDLCVGLGNLLDNAIEACQKIANLDDRYISVSIVTAPEALVVLIINSISRSGVTVKGLTGKPDKLMHGYGIKNVAAIAEKYGGTFQVQKKESSYEVSFVLPFKDN